MAKFLSGKLLAYKVSTGKRRIKLRLDSNFGFIQIQYIIGATRNSINEIDPVECKPTKKHYPNPPSLSFCLSFNCQSRDSRRKIVSPQTKWSKKEEKNTSARLLSIIVQGKDPCLPVLLPLLCTVTQLTKQDRRNQGTFAPPPTVC